MALAQVEPRRFTAKEYMRLWKIGFFGRDEHIELIDGQIVVMAAHGPPHGSGMMHSNNTLVLALNETHLVGPATTVWLDAWSVPQPDFAVVHRASPDAGGHIAHPDLLVEVSHTSLRYDRGIKASLYARAGIQEYWIVNVKNRQLEVHRDPGPADQKPFGFGYATITMHRSRDVVSPLARPDAKIRVGDLF